MTLCLWQFAVFNDVRSLSRILVIRILWNLVKLFSTMMSSSSLIMVYMAPCFKELLSLVYEKFSIVKKNVCFLRWIVLIIILWNLVTLLGTIMSSSFRMAHIAPCLHFAIYANLAKAGASVPYGHISSNYCVFCIRWTVNKNLMIWKVPIMRETCV